MMRTRRWGPSWGTGPWLPPGPLPGPAAPGSSAPASCGTASQGQPCHPHSMSPVSGGCSIPTQGQLCHHHHSGPGQGWLSCHQGASLAWVLHAPAQGDAYSQQRRLREPVLDVGDGCLQVLGVAGTEGPGGLRGGGKLGVVVVAQPSSTLGAGGSLGVSPTSSSSPRQPRWLSTTALQERCEV